MSERKVVPQVSHRGLVLLSLLLILSLLGLAIGASLWLTRVELWAAGRARSEAQAAYTAEAGLAHGLALLAPDVDWTALEARSVTALSLPEQPGPWRLGEGGMVAFPGAPFGYELEVLAVVKDSVGPKRVLVRSLATAARGASVVLRAWISRDSLPYAPAALVTPAGRLRIEVGAWGSPLSPGVEIAGGPDTPALGAASRVHLGTALDRVEEGGVLLEGGTTATVRAFDVGGFIRRSGLPLLEATGLSLAPRPGQDVAARRLRGGVAPGLVGKGVVAVQGDFDIAGPVDFRGLLLVQGRLRLGGSSCRIEGMVWADEISFAGPCRLRADAGALLDADRVLRLPRRARMTALIRE